MGTRRVPAGHRRRGVGVPARHPPLAAANNVGLLPTPTNASHLNRIECHLWSFTEFVVKGSDYPTWTEFTKATHAHLHRRNRDRDRDRPRIIDLENHRRLA